jgi:zinc and cadmium transporter
MSVFPVVFAFLLLPTVAALLVWRKEPSGAWSRLLLAFSGAFLLAVSVLHMLPELYAAQPDDAGYWILGGFLLQVVLDFFSAGIEHGHDHGHVHTHAHEHGHHLTSQGLTWAMLGSLALHSFAEGIPFASPEVRGNIPFLLGVLLHKVPMAVALAAVVAKTTAHNGQRWASMALFAAAAPLGLLLGTLIGTGGAWLHYALALAIGMLLHISTTIILESTPEHRFSAQRFAALVAGALVGAWLAH